jgi:uncharacterized protein (DUF736 family)
MSTIGTFTKLIDGTFIGAINTLALNIKTAQFRPVDRTSANAPDYRVYAGKVELGAAWLKTGDNGDFLSVKLDDHTLEAPVYAKLCETDDTYSLFWSRYEPVEA